MLQYCRSYNIVVFAVVRILRQRPQDSHLNAMERGLLKNKLIPIFFAGDAFPFLLTLELLDLPASGASGIGSQKSRQCRPERKHKI